MGRLSSARYLTQEEIEQIEIAIYNNQPLPKYKLNGDTRDRYKSTAFTKWLLEDEEWDWLPNPEINRFAITSKGRLFNGTTLRQIKIYFNKETIFFKYQPHYVDFQEVFEEFGWEFDLEVLLNNYLENQWGFMCSKRFKEIFLL